MNTITHYKFSITLPKGWEEDKDLSIAKFILESKKKSAFIDGIMASDIIRLDELTIYFDVSVALKEKKDTPKEEAMDSDFWVRVAQGEQF